jgi:ZU5 domain
MRFHNTWRHLRLLALAALAGCGIDRPTEPAALAPTSPNQSLTGGLTALQPLQRRVPLADDISVSAQIGLHGGVISIPKAGFLLVVPPGAVSAPTNFRVTALEGSAIAYEFEPHGVTFARELRASQDLSHARNVLSLAPLLKAGYFAHKQQIGANGLTALVSEIFLGSVDLSLTQFRWGIPHFSGYIVAW